MGIYSHMGTSELEAIRERLLSSLHDRLTQATSASSNSRSVQYQQRIDDLRRELADIEVELARRAGQELRGPIYVV